MQKSLFPGEKEKKIALVGDSELKYRTMHEKYMNFLLLMWH